MPEAALNLFGDVDSSAEPTLFAEIVFDRPLDHAYTYGVPDALRDRVGVGKRLLVPFGRGDRQTPGFCVGISGEKPARQVKRIVEVLDDEALLTDNLLRLTRWLADYYLCGWGQVLNAVVPAGVKDRAGTRSVVLVELIPDLLLPSPVPTLTPKQKAVLQILKDSGAPVEINQLRQLAACAAGPIRGLFDKGFARRKIGRIESPVRPEPADTPEPVVEPFALTADQTEVWAVLEKSVREGGFKPFLLHGVTGSGKTELYLRAINEVIRQGKQALVLVPEISLTPQTIRAFQGRCGDVAVLHSHLQNAERGAQWRKIAAGRVQVVVGRAARYLRRRKTSASSSSMKSTKAPSSRKPRRATMPATSRSSVHTWKIFPSFWGRRPLRWRAGTMPSAGNTRCCRCRGGFSSGRCPTCISSTCAMTGITINGCMVLAPAWNGR